MGSRCRIAGGGPRARYREASTLHVNTIARLQADAEGGKNPPVFETLVREG